MNFHLKLLITLLVDSTGRVWLLEVHPLVGVSMDDQFLRAIFAIPSNPGVISIGRLGIGLIGIVDLRTIDRDYEMLVVDKRLMDIDILGDAQLDADSP